MDQCANQVNDLGSASLDVSAKKLQLLMARLMEMTKKNFGLDVPPRNWIVQK